VACRYVPTPTYGYYKILTFIEIVNCELSLYSQKTQADMAGNVLVIDLALHVRRQIASVGMRRYSERGLATHYWKRESVCLLLSFLRLC
jgi:hypothetical protein